jgi:hypothetical protein
MSSSSLPWRVIVLMLNPGVFSDGMNLQLTGTLEGDFVDVHRPITALRRNVFVHGIPGDPLNVVTMFDDLFDAFSVACTKNSCDVIGTTGKDVFPRGAPREIVDLHRSAPVESS